MQFSSFLHATAVVISLGSALAAASIAYADAPRSSHQVSGQATPSSNSVQAPTSNNSPYDNPDFVVPENDISS